MPNLYHDTAEAAVATPPLEGHLRSDVLIVGGGFTGLSAALHLAEQGANVVLLEAHEAGWGASGRNGGQVNAGLKPDPETVERDFGPDLGARMNALAGAAPGFVFELIERLGIRCDARRNGTIRAAYRTGHAVKLRETTRQLLRRNAPVELLDGADVARLTGTHRYLAAMLDRRGGDLNPLSFARGLARAVMQAGARICGGSPALTLERHEGMWRCRVPSGSVLASHVVLATNGYTDDLWPALKRTIVPVFGAMAATAVLPEALAAQIMPGRAVLYESGAITVYYRVDTGGRLLFGGRGPLREINESASIAHLLDYARTLWPPLADVPWTHAWGGQLAMTTDHYPHVHESAEGIIICLGYNGRGVALSTAMGARIAARILRPSEPFDMPITDLKTIALHRYWPMGVRAAIVRGRVTDFFGG